jgi:hypothetical protein
MTSSTSRHSRGQSHIAILSWQTTSGCISVAFPALQQSIKRLFCRPWKSLTRNSAAGTHCRKVLRALNSQFDATATTHSGEPSPCGPEVVHPASCCLEPEPRRAFQNNGLISTSMRSPIGCREPAAPCSGPGAALLRGNIGTLTGIGA